MDDKNTVPEQGGGAAGAGDADKAGSPGPAGAPDIAAANKRIADLERELDDCKSRLLRAAADYQNALRRAQINVAEAREFQLFDVAKALVPLLDHFDRALEVDPQKVAVQSVLQGVQILRAEMSKTLEGFGVRRIDAKPGDEFDPARHEAMLHQSVPGVAAGHVAAQLQAGYVLGERTLRPVKVSLAS